MYLADSGNVAIVADSTCDLSKELVQRAGVSIVPLCVSLGNATYRDGIETEPAALFRYVDETGGLPKTAAPSPEDFAAVFSKLAAAGRDVVYVGISSELSASLNNARIAAEGFENVSAVDSRSLSAGIGLLVLRGAEYAAEGLPAREIAERLTRDAALVEASFVIDTLTYLHKGGRCSSVAALGSNLLKIKPCIEVRAGRMQVGKKYQGTLKRCLEKYVEERLTGRDDIDSRRVFITHTLQDESLVEHVKAAVERAMPFDEILITKAGSTIASHCGPGTLGVLFCRKAE